MNKTNGERALHELHAVHFPTGLPDGVTVIGDRPIERSTGLVGMQLLEELVNKLPRPKAQTLGRGVVEVGQVNSTVDQEVGPASVVDDDSPPTPR